MARRADARDACKSLWLDLEDVRGPFLPFAAGDLEEGFSGLSAAHARSLRFLKVVSTLVSSMSVATVRDGSALVASDFVVQARTLLGIDSEGQTLRVTPDLPMHTATCGV